MRNKTGGIVLSIGLTLTFVITGCLAYFLSDNQRTNKRDTAANFEKLVIDTDAGGDDAMAILLVLSAWANADSNFEVAAITCVYGNTWEKNVETNVLKTLIIANATQIPVYGGVQRPLVANYTADNYFGEDGFGDFEFDEEITVEVDRSKHAVIALVELAEKYKGELSILALGPPTNIALASRLDPNFMNNIKRLYIMGGSVAGIGNKSPGVEFNFGQDPESNYIVLNATKRETVVLYPWETTLGSKIPLEWRMEELGSTRSRSMEFMNKVEKKTLTDPLWTPADVMAAAVMIWPDLATKKVSTSVVPVIDGAARGGLLIDYYNTTHGVVNTEIIQELDTDAFKRLLLYHFS